MDLAILARMLGRSAQIIVRRSGFGKRQRTQQDRVDYTEDGTVGADPEGKGEIRDEGESRAI